jgi:ketosteroid isomerase-like protein
MSEENVEIVRLHIDAWRAEEATRALSFLDPHIVMDLSRTGGAGVGEGPFYGPDAISDHFRRYAGTFEEYQWEIDRLTDLGAGAVLVIVTESGRGKGSGVSVDRPLAVLYTLVDRKIVRITFFRDEQEALEAAGLSQ